MKDVVVYKCLFVWEAQLCVLQALSADIPCSLSCASAAATLTTNNISHLWNLSLPYFPGPSVNLWWSAAAKQNLVLEGVFVWSFLTWFLLRLLIDFFALRLFKVMWPLQICTWPSHLKLVMHYWEEKPLSCKLPPPSQNPDTHHL